MSEDMTSLVPLEDGTLCREITPPDYVEGPCMFKRDGKYYFMWSAGDWTTGTYRVNAAFADSPFGPFEDYTNVLNSGDGKLANGPGHNGYFYLPEEDLWICVYHRHRPDNNDGNARFMCLDVMRFGEDGSILPVQMTTEWEYKDGKGSLDHGFASYIALTLPYADSITE
jgi:beta-xylosidase